MVKGLADLAHGFFNMMRKLFRRVLLRERKIFGRRVILSDEKILRKSSPIRGKYT